MQYFHTEAFRRTYQSLDSSRKKRVDKALIHLEELYSQGQRPFGIGLKWLKPNIWEIRAGLDDRILFRWTGDSIELLIVGNHNEIRRMLKLL